MYKGQDWILRSLNVIMGKTLHPIISNSKTEVALTYKCTAFFVG